MISLIIKNAHVKFISLLLLACDITCWTCSSGEINKCLTCNDSLDHRELASNATPTTCVCKDRFYDTH